VTTMTNKNSRNTRNIRNGPYILDGIAVKLHHSAAGVLWRWRTELTFITAVAAAVVWLSRYFTWTGVVVVSAATLVVVMGLPWPRRFVLARAWCVISRHRLQRLCFETRMHTRSGRLPLILRIHPIKVGERAHIWCRAGICKEDFDAHTGEISAACYARETRVARNPRWSQLVTIDIIRHDLLSPQRMVTSHVTQKTPATNGQRANVPQLETRRTR